MILAAAVNSDEVHVTIKGDEEEFFRDLARIKSIPPADRRFKGAIEGGKWVVYNARKYIGIYAIHAALNDYDRQLKLL